MGKKRDWSIPVHQSAVLRGLFISLFLALSADGILGQGDLVVKPPEQQRAEQIVEITVAADALRLQLAEDPYSDATGRVTEDFDKTWTGQVLPRFQEDKRLLKHFFATSLILLGRLESDQCVVGFYNPWVDSILLTSWKRSNGTWRANALVLCSGEEWRSRTVDKSVAAPGWLKTGQSLTKSVIQETHEAISVFEKLFPLDGTFEFPVIEATDPPDEDLGIIKLHMLFRLAYAKEKFAKDRLEAMEALVKRATDVIAQGSKEAVGGLVSAQQDAYVAETITMLPENVRKSLYAHWFVAKGEEVSVILGSPVVPRLFVVLFLDFGQKQAIRALGLYDFEVMRRKTDIKG